MSVIMSGMARSTVTRTATDLPDSIVLSSKRMAPKDLKKKENGPAEKGRIQKL